jgi:ferrous iron transport protein B
MSAPSTPAGPFLAAPPRRLTAALVGNPNTGKSTLFNALSGLRQRTGNYPGVTVETKKGQMICAGRPIDLIDLPGTYSLAPRSPDEMVAVDVILGQRPEEPRPDVVISIVDASNLERNLYLTTQVLELGVPVVVALNMIDVAEGQGTRIDAERLSRELGVPVVPIQANKGRGLDRLRGTILSIADCGLRIADSKRARGEPGCVSAGSACSGSSLGALTQPRSPGSVCESAIRNPQSAIQTPFPEAFEKEAAALHAVVGADVPPYLVRRLLLDVGGWTEQQMIERCGPQLSEQVSAARARLAAAGCPVPAVEARARYGWIRHAAAPCITRAAVKPVTWTDRLDRVLTHRVWGTLVFLVVMFVVFQSIFTWARPLMKLIGWGKDSLADLGRDHLPPGPFTSLLLDGVLEGVGSVLVFLPQILILFLFIAVLEDCGYMARAAFLMDRLMSRCGLSGKSFIPMLSSLACAVPGIMATRVIENRRDRLATILVAPLMSCSARLPVYVLLIGAFLTKDHAWWVPGVTMFAMYAIGLIVAPLVALALKSTLLRGETPLFVMEMPLYKRPGLRTVLGRMFDSGWAFVRRAGTIILATMVLVWALLYFPSKDAAGQSWEKQIAELQEPIAQQQKELKELETKIAAERKKPASEELESLDGRRAELEEIVKPVEKQVHALEARWKRDSYLGRLGRWIEPALVPLGWDWRIGVATLASFPAREVVVGTLGIVYQVGKVDTDEIRDGGDVTETDLGKALSEAKWEGSDRKVFTVPVALSVMVFFALCCQCASTLAVIRRETKSWAWPTFTFAYMTGLAYLGALVTYQLGRLFL